MAPTRRTAASTRLQIRIMGVRAAMTGRDVWSTRRSSDDGQDRDDTGVDHLILAIEHWESLCAALVTELSESTAPVPATLADLAGQIADAAADATALAPPQQPPPWLRRPGVLLDLLHLLRHDLANHSDRIADLTNARAALSPATNVDVAAMRRLLEQIVAEALTSTDARRDA